MDSENTYSQEEKSPRCVKSLEGLCLQAVFVYDAVCSRYSLGVSS